MSNTEELFEIKGDYKEQMHNHRVSSANEKILPQILIQSDIWPKKWFLRSVKESQVLGVSEWLTCLGEEESGWTL